IVFGIFFLFLFHEYYNLEAIQYFMPENTKRYNQKSMWWLPYSHPTFLTSFLLIGMFFSENLFYKKLIPKKELIVYALFCLIVIVFMGSRLMLLAWVLYVLTFFCFRNKLYRTIFLGVTTIALLAILFGFICKIDSNRCVLWNI